MGSEENIVYSLSWELLKDSDYNIYLQKKENKFGKKSEEVTRTCILVYKYAKFYVDYTKKTQGSNFTDHWA